GVDGREDSLVVREALHEAPRPHRVVVLAGPREPLDDGVFERVVDQGHDAEQGAPLAGLAGAVDLPQEVGHVVANGAFGVGLARPAPLQALDQAGLADEGGLQVALGREAWDDLADVRHGGRPRGWQPTSLANHPPPSRRARLARAEPPPPGAARWTRASVT